MLPFKELPLIKYIIKSVSSIGGKTYLVGGAVRDLLLKHEPCDYDFYLENIDREQFQEIFPEAKLVGNDFTVYKLAGNDFTVYDKTSQTTLEQELARRDFAINAMALDLDNDLIIDPFLGKEDLEKRIIRALPGAIEKDPLRIYRGARLVTELSTNDNRFKIESDTLHKFAGVKKELVKLAPERVFQEFRRSLISEYPVIFFEILKKAQVLDQHFPELSTLIGVEQPEKFHPEGDVFTHTMLSLQVAAEFNYNELVRFGVLVHDLGKGLTPTGEWPHHYGHEKRGLQPLYDICARLKLPNKWLKSGKLAVLEHDRGFKWKDMSPGKIVKLFDRASRSPLGVEGLKQIIICDKKGRGNKNIPVPEVSEIDRVASKMYEETTGLNFKNITPGPEYGEAVFYYRCQWIKENMKSA